KPAVDRFPGTMAKRVQDLAAFVDEEYGGHAERLWADAKDGAELRQRIAALPGFGEMKIKALTGVLAKRFDVAVAKEIAPNHPTLGDVDSAQALEEYQAKKRAYKSARRQAERRRKQEAALAQGDVTVTVRWARGARRVFPDGAEELDLERNGSASCNGASE